jgi:hypothetical protein
VSGYFWSSSGSTHDNAEREHIGRLANLAFEECLGTTPVFVASCHALDVPATGEIGSVVKVSELDLSKYHSLSVVMVVNHDVIRLDV